MASSSGLLWLNERHIKDRLDDKNLYMTTRKYLSDHRRHRHGHVDEPKKQRNRIFINKESAIKVIMNCTTTGANKLRTRLGSKKYDVISTKQY